MRQNERERRQTVSEESIKKITSEHNEYYMKHRGRRCPFCTKVDGLAYTDPYNSIQLLNDCDIAYSSVRCEHCNIEWTEEWRLKEIHN